MRDIYPYASEYAYFIAKGESLRLIQEFEKDCANGEALYEQIRQEFGADFACPHFIVFNAAAQNPALKHRRSRENAFEYVPNPDTDEGRAFKDRLERTPWHGKAASMDVFAKRLTGAQRMNANPDKLEDMASFSSEARSSYVEIGDAYVIKVPIVVRGIYEALLTHNGEEFPVPVGLECSWFTPPDAEQIPHSAYLRLLEEQQGDQLTPRSVLSGEKQAHIRQSNARRGPEPSVS
jgi:hypothetical protein